MKVNLVIITSVGWLGRALLMYLYNLTEVYHNADKCCFSVKTQNNKNKCQIIFIILIKGYEKKTHIL